MFIVNKGQVDKNIHYYTQTLAGPVFVTKSGELVYSLSNRDDEQIINGVAFREKFGEYQQREYFSPKR